MNSTTLRLLGFVVAFLVIALMLVQSDDADLPESGTLLFPDMRAVANDVDHVTISKAGEDDLELVKSSGQWTIPSRDGYTANISTIRDVLIAMTDARVVEAKTANPDLHARLGVDSPTAENSKGTQVSASAGDNRFAVIFGNVAQGSYRYARVSGEDQSWLIDQNPDIPSTAGEWLNADIIDIDSAKVSAVTILHPDGETIAVTRASEEEPNFEVRDIPEGRELSYSTVANGIGGALNDLDLDDVRRGDGAAGAVVTELTTFDGLTIVARTVRTDDENWISLEVSAEDDNEDAAAIRERVSGWQYRIADYKANLLTRRWEDILKEETEE